VWYELNKSIATKEEWEKRRSALRTGFESYLTKHNYITCRNCHSLSSFGGPRSHMKLIRKNRRQKWMVGTPGNIHQGIIGHVYGESG
jgi:nitrate/TMAO reductase-like tetraheme cytochrome c subunit